jgi:hypothetical protein
LTHSCIKSNIKTEKFFQIVNYVNLYFFYLTKYQFKKKSFYKIVFAIIDDKVDFIIKNLMVYYIIFNKNKCN